MPPTFAKALIELLFTIEPFLFFNKIGKACLQDKNIPLRFISIIFSNIFVFNLCDGVTACSIPALLKTVSKVLKFLVTYLYKLIISFSFDTSAFTK